MKVDDLIAIVYFDDTQIIGRMFCRECGQALKTVAEIRREYSGIMENDFTDREDFITNLNALILDLGQPFNRVPEILYIGVANEFCQVETQTSTIEFDRMTKINKKHLQALWQDTQFNEENREIISKKALYFKLEEFEDVMLDALGMATMNLQMVSSAISISNEFRPLVNVAAVRQAGFQDFKFIAIAECELFMIPEKHRDAGCSLVRSDFFTTSVANVVGDGLTQISHFNMGAGHIVSEIAENFCLDYDVAMQLLQKCTPTFTKTLGESYSAGRQTIPANIFNDFVMKHLNEYANRLADFDTARLVYLSGGNLDLVYGVKNILSNTCNRRMYHCQDVLSGQVAYPENTLQAMARFVINCR